METGIEGRHLWAGWRSHYVGKPATDECVFCRLLASTDLNATLVLHRDSSSATLLNTYPYTIGHLIVDLPFGMSPASRI